MDSTGRQGGVRTSAVVDGATVASGERFVSVIRLIFGPVFLGLVAYYGHFTERPTNPVFLVSGVACLGLVALGVAMLAVIRFGRFRDWMSTATTLADLLLAGVAVWTTATVYPLHFATSVAPAILFVVVGIAAVRLAPAMVLATGVIAAGIHLGSAAYFFRMNVGAFSYYVSEDGPPMLGVNFFDELSKAVIMITVAWTISFVTASLRSSRRRYVTIFEQAPDGIFISDAEGVVQTTNQRLAEMIGVDQEEIVGSRVSSLITSGEEDSVDMRDGGLIGRTASLQRHDGILVPIKTVTNPVALGDGRFEVTTVRDVSKQLMLEKQLSRSQEMEAFGNLAGGLAHDFNNILGGILGAASLGERLAKRVGGEEGEQLDDRMRTVKECGNRARDVVGRLLSFSRGANLTFSRVDLGEVVSDVTSICHNTFGPEYDIAPPEPASGVPLVFGDRQALTQAILNLCVNARDAMPAGGRIALTLEFAGGGSMDPERYRGADPSLPYWRIAVGDEGPGFRDDDLEMLFDPFYSTKPTSEGSGLGLPMVMSIAHRHRGFVGAEAGSGEGAVFGVYIPAWAEADASPATGGDGGPQT